MKGLILIDKPIGPTSSQVTNWVKQILGEKKAAHCGTLDPNVSGVLPILIGKGIKLQEYLQKHGKEYVCLIETQASKEEFKQVLKEFTGKIYQKPPEMSAVAKKTRVRKIYSIQIIDNIENNYLLRIKCQHGTYIRKLVEDIGIVLGKKMIMKELRRTRSGLFKEQECVTLTRLRDAYELRDKKPELLQEIIKPLEEAVKGMATVTLKSKAAENVKKGAPVYAPGIKQMTGSIEKRTPVALFDENGKLIGMGISKYSKKQVLEKNKGLVIKTKKIVV